MAWPAFKSRQPAPRVLFLTLVLYCLLGQPLPSSAHKILLTLCSGREAEPTSVLTSGRKCRGKEGNGIPPGTQVVTGAAQEKGGEPMVT